MGLGDMLGKAVSSFGGTDEIVSKISESGLDIPRVLEYPKAYLTFYAFWILLAA